MSSVASALERVLSTFSGLGLWRTERSVWGFRIRARTFDRGLYLWMHRCGLMGAAEKAALGRLVQPGMLVVDAGANLGPYSLLLARLVGPKGRVVAFEPDPDLFALLRENCAANGATNVECHSVALGSSPERMLLHRPTLNSGDNHLGSRGNAAFRSSVEVEVATLDSLMPGIRPDFIKVDVQGWELKVLRGMEGTLRSAQNVGIFLEICPKWLRRAGERPEDLYRYVRGLGFRFFSCRDWREMDEASFLGLVGSMAGEAHVDLLAARSLPAAVASAR